MAVLRLLKNVKIFILAYLLLSLFAKSISICSEIEKEEGKIDLDKINDNINNKTTPVTTNPLIENKENPKTTFNTNNKHEYKFLQGKKCTLKFLLFFTVKPLCSLLWSTANIFYNLENNMGLNKTYFLNALDTNGSQFI